MVIQLQKKKKKIKKRKIKLDINEIVEGSKKSEKQKIKAIKNIKTLYESQEKLIKLCNDYFKIVSEAKYKTIYGEELKILSPKQMFQSRIAIAQIKECYTSKNLLNELRQIIYSLYRAKVITKIVYNNIMNSIMV